MKPDLIAFFHLVEWKLALFKHSYRYQKGEINCRRMERVPKVKRKIACSNWSKNKHDANRNNITREKKDCLIVKKKKQKDW